MFSTGSIRNGSPSRKTGASTRNITAYCKGSTRAKRRPASAKSRSTSGGAAYDVAPDPLAEDDPRNPRFDPRYAEIPDEELPRTESLKQTIERALPYWQCVIFPELSVHDEILVVAHGNSLRGIIKHLKGISDAAISELNLPTAVPYVFEFDDKLRLVKDYFLGDPEQIRKLMEAVANQGKK